MYQKHNNRNKTYTNNSSNISKKSLDKSQNDATSSLQPTSIEISKCDNTITYNMERIAIKTLPFHKIDDKDNDQKLYRAIMEKFCSKIQDLNHQNALNCLFDSKYSSVYESVATVSEF